MASTTTRRLPLPPSRRARVEEPDAEQTAVEPYRLTPKLARRVALLGGLVVIGFAALVGRLWALQVLAGPHYAARAQANQVRSVRVEAPRGQIVDRNRNVLVTNKPVTAVELWPSGLPKVYSRRVAELRELAQITRVNVRQVTRLIVARRQMGDMLDPVVVRLEVRIGHRGEVLEAGQALARFERADWVVPGHGLAAGFAPGLRSDSGIGSGHDGSLMS